MQLHRLHVVDGLESWGCTEKSRAHQLTPALKNVLGCEESARALGGGREEGTCFPAGCIAPWKGVERP